MVHLSDLVFLLCVWFPFKTVSNEVNYTEDENAELLLQDFKVKISPGFINITWNCNITKSMQKYTYKVYFQINYRETLNVAKCSYVHEVHKYMEYILHEGLSVKLSVYEDDECVYSKNIENKLMPDGKSNSGAENFACEIYNVYIMNCSWTVGKEAPEDTQYILVLRQSLRNNAYVRCQDYRKDSFGRQVGCVFKQPDISFKSDVYVEILGSSNQTSIQFFDKRYYPLHDVILDPPRNITLTYQSDELEIKWQKPETYEDMQEENFEYSIKINNKEERVIEGNEENMYKTTKFHPNEKVNVSMKVKFSEQNRWSAWSKPQIIGYNSTQLTTNHILIVLGLGTAIFLVALIFLCYRFRIWKKLFPQVPKPSMKLFEEVEQKQKAMQKDSDIEITFMEKEEEDDVMCSLVAEMPEKL